jgi:aromatic ring-opening dioxygenase catalytic subunit (LigB family)
MTRVTVMTLPTYFISHGGGPWPFVSGPLHDLHHALAASLRALPAELPAKPVAVLVVSAHWEEAEFTVASNPQPGMLYDYFNFPPEAYRVRYAAPGSPDLARRVQDLVQATGMHCGSDEQRGFDHGTFVPLSVIYPAADIPVVQLSMKRGYDPVAHRALGRALAPLRDEGVLIIGSGLSFHTFGPGGRADRDASRTFDDWLHATLTMPTADERARRLDGWTAAPAARAAHAREDHLMPLMVVNGAAGSDRATRTYHDDAFMGGAVVSGWRFDAA